MNKKFNSILGQRPFKIYSPGFFARLIGKSVSTLQRWDKNKTLVADRSATNRRYYTEKHYHQLFTLKKVHRKKIVAYLRVRSAKNRALINQQKQIIESYADSANITIDDWIEDVGLIINHTRDGFLQLMDAVESHSVEVIIFTSKDRLAIHSYDWFARYCYQHGTKIINLELNNLTKEELDAELKHVRDNLLDWEQCI